MRPTLAILILAAAVAPALAQDKPPAPAPPKPMTEDEAVAAVLEAWKAKDEPRLKILAARDEPDPWIVADDLCARGEQDAAAAFATAAPRKDTEKLPDYLAAHRARPYDAEARKALDAANAALLAGQWAEALAAIDAAKPAGGDVVAVRLGLGRGFALRGLNRLEESATAFGEVAKWAEAPGWLKRAARGFDEQGVSAGSRGDFRTALEAWSHRLDVEDRRGNRAGVATALGDIGSIHRDLGDYAKALDYQERSLKLMEDLGYRWGVAWNLERIGSIHQSRGDYAKALDFQERALKLWEELGDRRWIAATLGNIGTIHFDLGDYAKALDFGERGLKLMEELGERADVAKTLGSIGNVHSELGDYAKALDYQERALKLKEELGDRAEVARTLGNIGGIHIYLGNYAKALDYLERALKLKESVGDRAGVANTLGNIGAIHESLGDYAKALDYQERALKLKEGLGDRAGVALTLGNIGTIHDCLGDYAKALDYEDRALKLKEGVGDRAGVATTLGNIGLIHQSLGDHAKAIDYQERALKLMEELGDRAGVARTLGNIANIHQSLGDYAKELEFRERGLAAGRAIGALDTVVHALSGIADIHRAAGRFREAIDSARQAIAAMSGLVRGVSEEQGASARGLLSGGFDVGAAAAVALPDAGAALFFLESGRAGALLEALKVRDSVAQASLSPSLAEAERTARVRQTVAANALRRTVQGSDAEASKKAEAEFYAAQKGMLDAVERIQREAKAIANVAYPRADSLDAIRGRLRGGEALVLYRLMGDDLRRSTYGGSIALVVTEKDARIVRLGKTADVEAACAALKADDGAVDPGAAVAALRKVVIDPLLLDAKTTRLLLSPDGALSYVPFALIAPEKEIVYVPSGTTYGILLDDRDRRGEGVLALGDPDYGRKAEGVTVASLRSGAWGLSPLPATREEAKAVGTVTLLGTEATEGALKGTLAKRPRWRAVHLACHGVLDAERPMFSSLAMAPSGEDDGFLSVLDVFRMKVPADLVVLSACETGKGKVVRGEGILGLARAFMFAGAPRVLVSLWKVDDEATKALMVKFYELWNSGKGAAAALREAQSFVRAQEKWKHPRYWAAWVLWGLPE